VCVCVCEWLQAAGGWVTVGPSDYVSGTCASCVSAAAAVFN